MTKALKFIVYQLPVFLAMLVGFFYMFIIFMNYEKDTTIITNAAFAITATFAALSFSLAGVVETDKLKERFTFAGERAFHAATSLIVASILKYALLTAKDIEFIKTTEWANSTISIFFGIMVGFMFFYSLMHFHTALRITNDLLWERQANQTDWDSHF